jgi:hypothetical protein
VKVDGTIPTSSDKDAETIYEKANDGVKKICGGGRGGEVG